MVSLRQIEVFVRLAEFGNMSEAAAALGLTQPALSQQLKALERRLGLTLFERVPKGMQLTPHGRELLVDGQATLNCVRDFLDQADRAASRPVGTIRFGVTPTIGPYLMPGVIKAVHRKYPQLKIYIREGIPVEQHPELVAGELDMVLSPLPIEGPGLTVEPLFREPLRIVVPPDDPLVDQTTLHAADFAGRTFLTLDHRHHYHRQLSGICERMGSSIMGDYQGTSLDALQQMVGSGVGLAVLPELYIRSDAGGLDVVRVVEPEGWDEYRSIGVSWRKKAAFEQTYREIAGVIAAEAASRLDLAVGTRV